jgi:hypothetical protein
MYSTLLHQDKIRIHINDCIIQRSISNIPPPPILEFKRQNASYPSHHIFSSGGCRKQMPGFFSTVLKYLNKDAPIKNKITHLIAANSAFEDNRDSHIYDEPLSHYIMSHYYDNLNNLQGEFKQIDEFCKLIIECYNNNIIEPLFKINSWQLISHLGFNTKKYNFEMIALIFSEQQLLKIAEDGDDGYAKVREEIDTVLSTHIYSQFHHTYSSVASDIKFVANFKWFIRMMPIIKRRLKQVTIDRLCLVMTHFFNYDEILLLLNLYNCLKN